MPPKIFRFALRPANKQAARSYFVILTGAALVTAAAYRLAWISDDALITLRYVANTLNGYGPVFNVGEAVQGYSHPLWFLLLAAFGLVFPDPILAAIGLGLALTFLTTLWVGWLAFRLSPHFGAAAGLLALFCLLVSASDPWLSFQTGGLENALSHLLMAAIFSEISQHDLSRPGWLSFWVGLLCLNRPDFVIFAAPLGLLLLMRLRRWQQAGSLILGVSPVLAWLLFAWRYYGNVIPNTAYAKMGIYASLGDALRQGVAYLWDWLHYDTLAAGSTLLFLGLALARRQSQAVYGFTAGTLAYLGYVLAIGGDFMRGRLLLPVFMAGLLLGLREIAARDRQTTPRTEAQFAWGALLLVILWLMRFFAPDPGNRITEMGIVNERAFYPGYRLQSYLRDGTLISPYLEVGFADDLRAYAQACGPFTLSHKNPGAWGYFAGPRVSFIDLLGLSDAFIARLPRQTQVESHPRPGHAEKNVPRQYLQQRGDISLIPGWQEAIYRRDCSLIPAQR